MEHQSELKNLDTPTTSSLTYETTGDDRLMTILYKKIETMEKELHELKTKKIIDETQLPTEILENSGVLPHQPKKLKRGRGYRPLLQSEIEDAKKHSPFASQQAKWLGVSISTYRKYSIMYGIYDPKPNIKGKRNLYDPEKGRFPLSKILKNEFKDDLRVDDWLVKDKLIRSGTLPPKCNICGYNKRRIVDNKIGLLLDHTTGDKRDYTLENLQLLCFNCTYECGRGYIRSGKHMFDPDWFQGAKVNEIDPKFRW